MFLKLKGGKHGEIKGESTADGHVGEIEVLGWSWGMQQNRDIGSGLQTGKATIHELKILKKVDVASTALMSALRSNEEIKEGILTLRKGGKGQVEYLKITINGGRLVKYDVQAGDRGGSASLFEDISFSFNQIEIEYKQQGTDGQTMGSTIFSDQFSGA